MICVSRAEKIYVSYGQDPIPMVKELLSAINLQGMIPAGARIGLKPNLVVARPAREGATTDPEVVEGVIQYLRDCGFRDLAVLEGSWVGDSTQRAFQVCGYADLAARYGVELIDLQKDSSHIRRVEELELHVCDELSRIDFLINFPVLKGHCQTKITCALKNLKGCIPNREKRRFHTLGLHKPIAYLNKAVRTGLVVVDGLLGDLDFEEGGNPVDGRIIVGQIRFRSIPTASLLGYEPAEIPYITLAEKLGVGKVFSGSDEVEVVGARHTTSRIKSARQVEELARIVRRDQACSACYGNLIHALGRLRNGGCSAGCLNQF